MTFGPDITVRTGLRGGVISASESTALNQGLISSRTSARTSRLAGSIVNQGRVEAINGGTIAASGSFINLPAAIRHHPHRGSLVSIGALTWAGGSIGGEGPVIVTGSASITDNVVKFGNGVMRFNSTFSVAPGKTRGSHHRQTHLQNRRRRIVERQ
jgi:hypothetical protein